MKKTALVILAAGHSRRMGRGIMKPLLPLAGRSMIAHVLHTARQIKPKDIVIVTSPDLAKREEFSTCLGDSIQHVVQDPPAGTGDAFRLAREALPGFDGTWIVLLADMPLIPATFLRSLIQAVDKGADLALGTVESDGDPRFADYGRVILDDHGQPVEVIEAVHLRSKNKKTSLCCLGAMAFSSSLFAACRDDFTPCPRSGEWYLTQLPALARKKNKRSCTVSCPPEDAMGINHPKDWSRVEGMVQNRLADRIMDRGVLLDDPNTLRLSWDSRVEPGVRIGAHVTIGPKVRIGAGSRIDDFCSLEGCVIGRDCKIGPFAHLRPGAVIGDEARIGNYVEVKNSKIGKGSKISHLSYIGDAVVGDRVNIGAGTITCNYDGERKHRTRIGDGAFIGSNVSFIAPVTIGARALVGAGSVITDDVAANMLAKSRVKQDVQPRRRQDTQEEDRSPNISPPGKLKDRSPRNIISPNISPNISPPGKHKDRKHKDRKLKDRKHKDRKLKDGELKDGGKD